ncbi:unnamed protein product [Pedinophyceae sp. YPF-701]|nr:unnamed protein product [Pedinophyceae sp. YPF-701]
MFSDLDRMERELSSFVPDVRAMWALPEPEEDRRETAGEENKQLSTQHQQRFWAPRLDLSETDKEIALHVDLPGVDKGDIKVNVSPDKRTLTISGKRSREVKENGYYERAYGSFSRSVRLPRGVDVTGIQASNKDGVLQVTIPKVETKEEQGMEIEIQ